MSQATFAQSGAYIEFAGDVVDMDAKSKVTKDVKELESGRRTLGI
jgi:hypothetical protein